MRMTLFLIIAFSLSAPIQASDPAPVENVVIVTLDGFRWQELFTGADEAFIDKQNGGIKEPAATKRDFWRPTADERRTLLMPFFWNTIAKQGQVFGDPTRQSTAKITNGLKFSYPGYSELFCGFADPKIDSNSKKPNPNQSVLEFLNEKPAYKGRVAAFCTWDVFPSIFRSSRNGLLVQCGWSPIKDEPLSERQKATNDLMAELPRYWADNNFDAVSMQAAREHIRKHKPRVLYVGLGETDEWGHGRRYDLYLGAAQLADRFIGDLWNTLQTMPEYANKTGLLVTTDHGRGLTRLDWTDHGKAVPGAEFIWIATLGPGVQALGVRSEVEVTQAQVAATIAHWLGEDFRQTDARIARPLPGVRETQASR